MDALSAFTSLIRTLWDSRKQRAAGPGTASGDRRVDPRIEAVDAPLQTREGLRDHLRDRMAQLQQATPEHRCEAFVRAVLLWELSDQAAADPRFSELVSRVASELRSDPRVGARLDELLVELPRQNNPR
jgi:hypothetical protein